MVELFAYGDESGIQANPRYCVLAGYIASPRQWSLFKNDWQSTLSQFGISEFHAKEFFQLKARKIHNQYSKWSKIKIDQFISCLVRVITSRRLYPIGCAIDVHAFNSFTIGERRYLTGGIWNSQKGVFMTTGKPSAPYFAAFHYYIRAALDKTPGNAKLHLVFDRQNIMESKARQTFEEMVALPNLMQGSEKLANIEYHIHCESPLQAADLYTYVAYRLAVDGVPNDYTLLIAMHELITQNNPLGLFNSEGIETNLNKYLPAEERIQVQRQK